MNTCFPCARHFVVAFLIAAVFCVGNFVRADVVWLRGQPAPVYGIIRSVDDSQLTLDEWIGHGQISERRFARTEVESYLVNFDSVRLGKLDPAIPSGYLEYAEELASQRIDPIAQGLGVRLYLIAAKHSSDQDRGSAICGLVAVARNAEERNRFLQIAELFDVKFRSVQTVDEGTVADLENQRVLLKALRKLRRGDSVAAAEALKNSALQKLVHRFPGGPDASELIRWAGMAQLSGRQLAQVLAIERALELSEVGSPTVGATSDWSVESTRSIQTIIKIPSLETATEFDPSKSVFRNGNWQEPK
jgi:hypothetical protein